MGIEDKPTRVTSPIEDDGAIPEGEPDPLLALQQADEIGKAAVLWPQDQMNPHPIPTPPSPGEAIFFTNQLNVPRPPGPLFRARGQYRPPGPLFRARGQYRPQSINNWLQTTSGQGPSIRPPPNWMGGQASQRPSVQPPPQWLQSRGSPPRPTPNRYLSQYQSWQQTTDRRGPPIQPPQEWIQSRGSPPRAGPNGYQSRYQNWQQTTDRIGPPIQPPQEWLQSRGSPPRPGPNRFQSQYQNWQQTTDRRGPPIQPPQHWTGGATAQQGPPLPGLHESFPDWLGAQGFPGPRSPGSEQRFRSQLPQPPPQWRPPNNNGNM